MRAAHAVRQHSFGSRRRSKSSQGRSNGERTSSVRAKLAALQVHARFVEAETQRHGCLQTGPMNWTPADASGDALATVQQWALDAQQHHIRRPRDPLPEAAEVAPLHSAMKFWRGKQLEYRAESLAPAFQPRCPAPNKADEPALVASVLPPPPSVDGPGLPSHVKQRREQVVAQPPLTEQMPTPRRYSDASSAPGKRLGVIHAARSTREAEASSRRDVNDMALQVFPWVPMVDFLRVIRPCAKAWTWQWYAKAVKAVVLPKEKESISEALTRASGAGLVILQPHVYSESVRITRSCSIIGLGPPGSVVIEAPKAEAALSFMKHCDAYVANIAVRCRNSSIAATSIFIPHGSATLQSCQVEGGIYICGESTKPKLLSCTVQKSPGCGVHFSDGSTGCMRGCTVSGSASYGILVDRGAMPEIQRNRVLHNRAAGLRVLLEPPDFEAERLQAPLLPDDMQWNTFAGNGNNNVVSVEWGHAEEDGQQVAQKGKAKEAEVPQ